MIIKGFIVTLLTITPVMAKPTCVIVVADDRESTLEIYHHELAHCNGWTHANQNHGVNGPRKGYISPKPPQNLVKPYSGKLESYFVSTKEALRVCNTFGCQWFK